MLRLWKHTPALLDAREASCMVSAILLLRAATVVDFCLLLWLLLSALRPLGAQARAEWDARMYYDAFEGLLLLHAGCFVNSSLAAMGCRLLSVLREEGTPEAESQSNVELIGC